MLDSCREELIDLRLLGICRLKTGRINETFIPSSPELVSMFKGNIKKIILYMILIYIYNLIVLGNF